MSAVGAQWLPRRLVRGIRNCYLAVLDARDRMTGRADELTPPRSLHFVGGGDFRAIGRAFLGHFMRVGGLQPSHSVLDIGCGTGRMAVPMLDYLDAKGSYTGFDISAPAIEWCRTHISSRNPRFRFVHADIYNLEYNPGGTVRAEDFRFPADDASIDFTFATSVFTHIHAPEVRRYLAEVRRVLRPEGRAFLTFFVIDGQVPGTAAMDFRFPVEEGYTVDPKTPERAIAFPAAWVTERAHEAGLELAGPLRHGSWSGRPQALDFQDILLLRPRHAHA